MPTIKRIRLKRHYRRVGSPHRVEPGEYTIDDPRLHGWGNYLVQNDHADVIEYEDDDLEPTPNDGTKAIADEPVETAEEGDPEPFDPESASPDELKAVLTDLGIDVSAIAGSGKGGNVLKADLVAAYREASGN